MRESYSKQVSPEGESATNALDFDVQIFISSGMPEGVLRSLFRQALDEGAKRVRFVVRGFEPQKVGELLKKLRMLLPDPYKDDVLVEVDPGHGSLILPSPSMGEGPGMGVRTRRRCRPA